jgi:peptidoglycan/LPS O-acetylase OafA/YrhL
MAVTIDPSPVAGGEAGTPPGDRRFRPDVQGLRAIAILLAIVYHADIQPFSGGYVGIEVFFVISGFVITGLLLRERETTGHTSLRSFYGRRARRIIPMATLVIIVTVIVTYHSLGTLVGHQTALDGAWSAVFLANVHFQATDTNYLLSQAPPSPLLNYWSLGVEEQFYIVYPALFLFLGWWAQRAQRGSFRLRLTVVLVVVIVASYTYSIVFTASNAQSAYFSLLVRSWELALGGLIAVYSPELRRIPQAWAAVASWVGLAVILVASVTLTPASDYPGALVAIPTLAAGLVIAAGASAPKWGVELLLRRQPFPFLALISFSLYLWHWPILEIAAQRRGVATLPVWDDVLLLVGAGILASLTYRFIENPVRHAKFLASRRWASLALGVFLIAASLTVATVELNRHPGGTLANNGLTGLTMGDACPNPSSQEVKTLMGTGPGARHEIVARVLVVGDSTACTMLPGLEAVAAPAGVQIENAAVIGCGVVSGEIAPQVTNGVNANAASTRCNGQASTEETRALRSGRPNVVLWSSSWERSGLVVGHGTDQKVLTPGSREWYSVLTKRISQRLKEFTDTGATVIMLTQAPFVPIGAHPAISTASDEDFARLNALMTSIASHTPHVKVTALANRICPSGPPCPLIVDSVWVRGDGAHYTDEGSLWVARWITPQLGIPALEVQNNALPVMKVVTAAHGKPLKGKELIGGYSAFHDSIARVTFEITDAAHKTTVIGSGAYSGNLWLMQWNTNLVPNGTYVLRSIAYNSAGDRSTSKGLTIKVAN